MEICNHCQYILLKLPKDTCPNVNHWKFNCCYLQKENDKLTIRLELKDEDRDKLDVADWLLNLPKTRKYNCKSCNRNYEIPYHLVYIDCICGHRSKLRGFGAIGTEIEDVLDAARSYLGVERMSKLSYLAEIIGGKYCEDYSGDKIRNMIRQELEQWVMTKNGWKRKHNE